MQFFVLTRTDPKDQTNRPDFDGGSGRLRQQTFPDLQ
jgi:hypothetical protein